MSSDVPFHDCKWARERERHMQGKTDLHQINGPCTMSTKIRLKFTDTTNHGTWDKGKREGDREKAAGNAEQRQQKKVTACNPLTFFYLHPECLTITIVTQLLANDGGIHISRDWVSGAQTSPSSAFIMWLQLSLCLFALLRLSFSLGEWHSPLKHECLLIIPWAW